MKTAKTPRITFKRKGIKGSRVSKDLIKDPSITLFSSLSARFNTFPFVCFATLRFKFWILHLS